ncbi:hypothetical protein BJX99DRAFT_5897 [Aspergillus californicus]
MYATTDAIQALLYGNISGCEDIENDRFGCVMRKVADAMSKSFRDQAYIDNEAGIAIGYTQVNATIIHEHWQWLTLPLLVWLLSAVTWLGTDWRTRRGKLQKWIDNPLPLLFLHQGVEDSRTDEMQGGLCMLQIPWLTLFLLKPCLVGRYCRQIVSFDSLEY